MELVPLQGVYVVEFDGVEIARSDTAVSLKESTYPERIYFPLSSIKEDYLAPTDTETYCPFKGTASYWSLTLEGQVLKDALWGYNEPYQECASIQNYGCFYTEMGPFQVREIKT
ncbi:DUF427 domain-containing protein [Sneathiella sp. P13V-1]|nr:DUF427 domain-containing protein [Sneathiella sp. P13V-1]